MSAITPNRTLLTQLFDAARVEGVAYLFALIALGRITVQELSDLSGDERHRIGRYLRRLESRGFVMRVQNGHGEQWFPTPRALELFEAGSRPGNLLVDFLPATSSSSSDLIRSEDSDLIRSDPEEEETNRHKIYLTQKYGLTGEKAAALAADPWITPLRLVAWMQQVKEMKRAGFKFTKSPEAYAISCLLRHDEPNQNAYHLAPAMLDEHLRWLPNAEEEEEDQDP
jgi:DNA-binding MarR family transcriptional regulator